MPTNVWPRETIASLISCGAITAHKDGNYGSLYPRVEEFGTDGVPFLTAKSLDAGRIDIDGAPRLADSRADALTFGFVQPDDILLSHNATIGRVAVVPKFEGRMLVGTSLTYFRLNSEKLRPRYFAAFLSGTDFQNQLVAVMSHSTRNQVPITAQRNLSVVVPPIEFQDMVALTVGQLDDKIEQNRRTGSKLEGLARAVFKAWFVDFEPVKAKAAGATAFPGIPPETFATLPTRFQDTTLAPVPEGWEVKPLSDIAEIVMGTSPPSDTYNDIGEGHALINGPVEYGDRFPLRVKWTTAPVKLAESGDLIFCVRGSTTGRRVLSDGVYGLGRGVCAIRGKYRAQAFVNQLIDSELPRLLAGTTGSVFPSLSAPSIKGFEILCPSADVIRAFCNFADPLLQTANAGAAESTKLVALRNYLLPRLLSGRVRVNNVDCQAREAL